MSIENCCGTSFSSTFIPIVRDIMNPKQNVQRCMRTLQYNLITLLEVFLIHGCTLLILLRCRSPAFVVRAVLVTFKNEFSAQGNSWTGEELLPFPHGPRPRGPTVWPFHFGPQILVMHNDVVEDHPFCHCGALKPRSVWQTPTTPYVLACTIVHQYKHT